MQARFGLRVCQDARDSCLRTSCFVRFSVMIGASRLQRYLKKQILIVPPRYGRGPQPFSPKKAVEESLVAQCAAEVGVWAPGFRSRRGSTGFQRFQKRTQRELLGLRV